MQRDFLTHDCVSAGGGWVGLGGVGGVFLGAHEAAGVQTVNLPLLLQSPITSCLQSQVD